ncbi:PlsC 1-acyl-sn-glycerol-3-phosphate acyltransferase [Burkholderiaceae bacterium]|jgi:1-acyl-sn-glycerol-3-phosphate acyltransferase
MSKLTFFAKIFTLAKIAGHIVLGMLILCFLFPWIKSNAKEQQIQNWALKLLTLLGIRLQLKNVDFFPKEPCLLVTNHISWVDIQAILAFKPMRFVAKSEVAGWPLFGWMATQLGTLFIRRDSAHHGRKVAQDMLPILQQESIGIFPEGTSTDGTIVLPFKTSLFEAAILSKAPVSMVVIRYFSETANRLQPSSAAAFIGDMGLIESIIKILQARPLVVELEFLPVAPGGLDRKGLAEFTHKQIASKINQKLP